MTSYRAHFLAASPDLSDGNFFRSVVLMFHHDDEGASGLVMNRPSPVSLAEVWNKVSDVPCKVEQPLHVGGPVEGPLMAIHGCASLSEIEIMEGVYISMQRENLNGIVSQSLRPFRFFSGYAGWGAGQLETEIEQGGWLLSPATGSEIFGDSDEMWKSVCDQVGREIIFPGARFDRMPNPTLN